MFPFSKGLLSRFKFFDKLWFVERRVIGEIFGEPLELFIDENFAMDIIIVSLNDSIGDNFTMSETFFHLF